MLSGWGNLVFFDTEEHQIAHKDISQIPKLGSQWRIIYDFKLTEYPQASTGAGFSLLTGDGLTPGSLIFAAFHLQKIVVAHCILNDNNQLQTQTDVASTQLPKVGEWTRIEIGHEKVDEKYFLSLSVGGREVGRKEVTGPELRNLTDVKVYIEHGFIRRLVFLEKQ